MFFTPAAPTPFAAALLAGGQSSRMGTDKALLDWDGEPLWQVQARKLSGLSPTRLLISCRVEQGLALEEGHAEAVFDEPENPGPLGAIVRCLEVAALPVVVLAVDLPEMTADFLRELLDQMRDENCGLVGRFSQRFEPLAALYPLAALPLLRNQMAMGNFKLQAALGFLVSEGLMRVRELRLAEVPLFRNANTPQEYASWKRPAPQASP